MRAVASLLPTEIYDRVAWILRGSGILRCSPNRSNTVFKSQASALLAVLNTVGFLGMVLVNAMANALLLGGKTTGQFSDQHRNLFVPSGLTFLIWAAVHILLAIYVTYVLLQAIKMPSPAAPFMRSIGLLFVITGIANATWIFSWRHEVLPLSLLLVLVLLVTLTAI